MELAREFAVRVARQPVAVVEVAYDGANAIADGATAETADSRRLYDESFSSPEFAEGARAFLEKRAPRF